MKRKDLVGLMFLLSITLSFKCMSFEFFKTKTIRELPARPAKVLFSKKLPKNSDGRTFAFGKKVLFNEGKVYRVLDVTSRQQTTLNFNGIKEEYFPVLFSGDSSIFATKHSIYEVTSSLSPKKLWSTSSDTIKRWNGNDWALIVTEKGIVLSVSSGSVKEIGKMLNSKGWMSTNGEYVDLIQGDAAGAKITRFDSSRLVAECEIPIKNLFSGLLSSDGKNATVLVGTDSTTGKVVGFNCIKKSKVYEKSIVKDILLVTEIGPPEYKLSQTAQPERCAENACFSVNFTGEFLSAYSIGGVFCVNNDGKKTLGTRKIAQTDPPVSATAGYFGPTVCSDSQLITFNNRSPVILSQSIPQSSDEFKQLVENSDLGDLEKDIDIGHAYYTGNPKVAVGDKIFSFISGKGTLLVVGN